MSTTPERRELNFSSLDDAFADAEKLAQGEVRTTGNHSFGQILEHLARTHDMATGKTVGPRPPFMLRLMMPVLKYIILSGPVKPGYKLPKEAEEFFWPEGEVDVSQALTHLKESIANYKAKGPLAVHPVFGRVSEEKNMNLNINHCAMHLSFVHPA